MTRRIFALAAAMAIAGCALDNQGAPQLTGPSELGLSLAISASPDVITQDGSSQSVIQIVARDANNQPLPGVGIRADLLVGALPVDFGALSTKVTSTGGDGRATITYTAPPAPPAGANSNTVVTVSLTPVGTNYASALARYVEIRLTPPGVVLPPNGTPIPRFIASPLSPRVGDKVFFDGRTSTDDGTIVSWEWNFGDGDSGNGPTVDHRYDIAGTYSATLTVTDDRGFKATSAPADITVVSADAPVANFTASPETAAVNDNIRFNGTLSTAAAEHTIVTYQWDFGDGSPLAFGPIQDHRYATPGVYTVVLKVTDDFGLTHAVSKTVTIIP